ncbi:MAG: YqjK-like family protein [Sideroxyarcus sp.]|nr:YqjK-like family protein [Sideroxyarcus sp.]
MNTKIAHLALRRAALRETIADQRAAMTSITRDLRKPLALADWGFRAVRFIREHPVLTTGSVTAFLTLRHHGLMGLVNHGWRMIVRHPTAFFLGLKFLATAKSSIDGADNGGETESKQPQH